MLGLALAVAVTLSTVAVNAGARRQAMREAERLGSHTVAVRLRDGARVRTPLTVAHADRLRRLVPSIAAASPSTELTMTVSGPLASETARVVGATAALRDIRDLPVRMGRFLLARDDELASRVCVLGAGIAVRMFGHRPPLGAPVRVGSEWFRVVGVLEARAFENDILAPLAALLPRSPELDPGQSVAVVWLKVRDGIRTRDAADAIAAALARAYSAHAYDTVIPQDLLDTRDATQRLFSFAGYTAAGLLFLLGAVAITNTTLASVAERTPEIGLRRAVGATRRDVVLQFLTEAGTISVAGGLGGVIGGLGLAGIIGRYSGWPMHLSPAMVVIVLTATVLLGLAAGAGPALRAARIQPIDALGHE